MKAQLRQLHFKTLKETRGCPIRNYYDEGTGYAMGWSAFLTGALIEAGVALLFAPQPGTELRGRLHDYTNRATG